ncbi:MAG: YicC family protein [Planctomycetota bacterium]|nr:MAG: YicC family protein [Planctomycetota bacterium]
MLLSMTGFGSAQAENGGFAVSAEVRCVNNRHLKVSVRCPDSWSAKEHEIEKLVRQSIARGTVNVSLRVQAIGIRGESLINETLLTAYWKQLRAISESLSASPPSMGELLSLPGVAVDETGAGLSDEDWKLVEQAVAKALATVQEFRSREGGEMRDEMLSLVRDLRQCRQDILERAPLVITAYRDKIRERVTQLLSGTGSTVSDQDLIREVSLFADKCDITEELARLQSHLGQFEDSLNAHPSAGRKLDFLCQELNREVNTIGSKSNDVAITHRVVDAKAVVEKLREIVQNVE